MIQFGMVKVGAASCRDLRAYEVDQTNSLLKGIHFKIAENLKRKQNPARKAIPAGFVMVFVSL